MVEKILEEFDCPELFIFLGVGARVIALFLFSLPIFYMFFPNKMEAALISYFSKPMTILLSAEFLLFLLGLI